VQLWDKGSPHSCVCEGEHNSAVYRTRGVEVMWRNCQCAPTEPGALLLDFDSHVINEWKGALLGHCRT